MNREPIESWLARDPDPDTREELRVLLAADDVDELESRFSERLSFGTAGLRGVLGAGPARMNRLVVQETTVGLAAYLDQTVADARSRGVVIGWDGRIKSDLFAEDAARVLAAMGFRVILADRPVATPVTAFCVVHENAAAGIMVTASHNPPEYNGYKVYWSNGAQIIPPHDRGIAAAIDVAATEPIPRLESDDEWHQYVSRFGEELESVYHSKVDELSIARDASNRADFGVAYTPLHGVGARPTEEALRRAGFEHVYTVASQREPDGKFPTVAFPNPEEPGAMDAVVALAAEKGAKLAIANDPDADRLAVAARRDDGTFQALSGDQIGALFGSYLLDDDSDVSVATTIVSSQLLEAMADAVGATYFETLTGFKWIANGAIERRRDHGIRFAFGYEEAIGYTIGELVRDKDGVSAARIFCEMAAELDKDGITVLERLEEIYRRYGLYLTDQRALRYGPDDHALANLTNTLRDDLPESIAGYRITSVTDLQQRRRLSDGAWSTWEELPRSDVLIFRLEAGARVIVRPSGTEPKIKCYYEIRHEIDGEYDEAMAEANKTLQNLVTRHQAELEALK